MATQAQKPIKFEMKVTGIPECIAALKKLGADCNKAVGAALLASAFVVSNAAKQKAPRKTGNLARSICPNLGKEANGTSGTVVDTFGPLREQTVAELSDELENTGKGIAYVSTNVTYAKAQEYYVGPHQYGVSPYMRPAMDENHGKVNDTFKAALKQVVAKAGGK